jgi:hypothetical protein
VLIYQLSFEVNFLEVYFMGFKICGWGRGINKIIPILCGLRLPLTTRCSFGRYFAKEKE